MAKNLYEVSGFLYRKNKNFGIFFRKDAEVFYIVTLQILQLPNGSFPDGERKSFPDFQPFRG